MSRTIDADALIGALHNHAFLEGDDRSICYNIIQRQPTIEPERKKGMWIPVTNGRGGFECDQCHNYAPSYQDGVEWLSGFCPNYGADMREPEDIPMEYFESGGR